jgi:hypothetical protein
MNNNIKMQYRIVGSVYVYSLVGNGWICYAKILAPDGAATDYFGRGVSIYATTAMIGSENDDDKASNAGIY